MKRMIARIFSGLGIVVTVLLLTARTASAVTATGGTITTSGIYRIHTFTTNNVGQGDTNFTVSIGGFVDVLVVAGGGGGGSIIAGGGGAGGLVYTNAYSVAAGTTTVAAGMGGAGALSASWLQGSNGSNSWLGALIAYGGGGGGGYNNVAGIAGASGGGGGQSAPGGTNSPSGQGKPGGSAAATNGGGGGGGAGSQGSNATISVAGMGGAGVSNNISGVWTNYAGGGGGGPRLPATVGTGGIGGGGMGAASGSGGSNGVPHTGGGGGGGGYNGVGSTGGNGGSGIVIVRYDVVNPFISNLPATNVTPTSATLNVFLTSTGTSPTTVTLYWGATDGGTNAGNWQYTNVFTGAQSIGTLSTNVTFGSSNATYYYSSCAANATGTNWASPSSAFFAGALSLVATTPNAAEPGPVAGAFTVYRPAIATNSTLVVFYTLGGTAVNGTDYQALSGVVTIPIGQISATIPVTPNWTQNSSGSQSVQATLAPGPYIIGPQSNDTVTIADYAAARVWSGTGNWNTPSSWTGGVLPGDGEGVTIGSGTVTLTNASPALAFLIVSNGATLTFDSWTAPLTASNVFVNGTVTHTLNTAAATNAFGQWVPNARVWIVCTNLVVATNGSINANSLGFAYLNGSGTGYGPGAGTGYGGGGYGGKGGPGGVGGLPYGSIYSPTNVGSGGGAQSAGYGGGAVLIQASGAVTVNNTISANGGNGGAGGGSGGSVYITCSTFSGVNGTVSATGGTGAQGSGGSGGGGRIAVVYNTTAQSLLPTPSVRFTVAFGGRNGDSLWGNLGDMGTLYFPDGNLLDRSVVTHSGELWAPGFTNWSASSVLFTNCQFRMVQTGLVMTVANDLNVVGTSTIMSKVQLTPASVTCGGNLLVNGMPLALTAGTNVGPIVTCGGNLIVTNAGTFAVWGGMTNAPGQYGAQVFVTNGEVRIYTNSWIYPYSQPVQGPSPIFFLNTLKIAAGGGIDATAKGFQPGAGPAPGSSYTGGTYGGKGGGNSLAVYGSSNYPVDPGCACGGSSGGTPRGGGVVRIQTVNNMQVDGSILADGSGTNSTVYSQSGGAGGSIYLICSNVFAGAGVLSAKGGCATTDTGSYGGGGGRIAVWPRFNLSNLSATNILGGLHSYGYDALSGTTGTVVMGQLSAPPLIVNLAPNNISYTGASLNGYLTSTGTAQATVWVYWGLSDQGTNKGTWDTNGSFGNLVTNQTTLITNVTVSPGTNYYYRFYASNSAGEAWATPTVSFATPAPLPTISNATFGATNITLTSACLNGYLYATGLSQTAVTVYWGPSDAGTNSGASWAFTNTFAGNPPVGPLSVSVNLPTPNTYYYYRYNAQNSGGQAWADPVSVFMAGEVGTIATAPNASEVGPTPGTITVYRASSMTNLAITVNYAIGGSATLGTDYTLSPAGTSIVMNAGVSNVAITVNPIWDDIVEGTEYVTLTLLPAQYAVAAQNSATVNIADAPVIPGSNGTVAVGDWWGSANWSKGRPPIAGDDVYLFNDTTITSASRFVSSLTVAAGKTLTFGDWNSSVSATNIVINGTITHNLNTATNAPWTPNARVWFICNNLLVATNGSINTDAKGFGFNVSTGYGPGGGNTFSGGGYGGVGGTGGGPGGATYGSITAPTNVGSGGGAQSAGYGGGAVLIQASGGVTVNNAISANGGNGGAGGGSGGSVFITCNTFSGTNGTVSANGGTGAQQSGAPGGGGRIAVVYNTAAQSVLPLPTVRFSAAYARHMDPNYATHVGDMGTLYFPDGSLLDRSLVLHCGELTAPGLTTWSANSLTFSNCQFRFAQDGLVFSVTNGLTATGSSAIMCVLQTTNALINCSSFVANNMSVNLTAGGTSVPIVNCTGNLVVTNGAILSVYGGVSNAVNPYGAQVLVGGDILIATNSWIYPYSNPVNGGSPYFSLYNLTIATGGGIDATGKGYQPGAGPAPASSYIGGTYGGKGGGNNANVYGSSNAPVDPGCACGSQSGGTPRGGGVVRIKAMRNIQLDGSILADGSGTNSTVYSQSGSGGGSVYLLCRKLLGGGVLSAKGGAASGDGGTYGGGGGRIAVWSIYNLSNLSSTNVLGGTHSGVYDGQSGAVGTIVFGAIIERGTMWMVQ